MPTGRNRRDNGVSTEAAAGGTSLRVWNRRESPLVAPTLTSSADAPKSTAPRPASSPAVRGFGTRGGRLGHHQDRSEIIGRRQPVRQPAGPGATGRPRHQPQSLSLTQRPQAPPPGTPLPWAGQVSWPAMVANHESIAARA